MKRFVDFFIELSIRRKRRALKSCVDNVTQAVKDANRAVADQDIELLKRCNATINRENARYEVLLAELNELEPPDDVVRRHAQA